MGLIVLAYLGYMGDQEKGELLLVMVLYNRQLQPRERERLLR
jgi:hypothetical protein